MRYEPKERWQKIYFIMVLERQNLNYSTMLGIIFIPCCKIVLMFYNGYVYEIGANRMQKLSNRY